MWQEAWEERKSDDFVMVSVAMDAQGWDRAAEFVQKAGVTFPAVVDREGLLWERFGFNFVPLQLFFDETGKMVYRSRGGPEEEVLARLDEALKLPVRSDDTFVARVSDDDPDAARALFAKGVAALGTCGSPSQGVAPGRRR